MFGFPRAVDLKNYRRMQLSGQKRYKLTTSGKHSYPLAKKRTRATVSFSAAILCAYGWVWFFLCFGMNFGTTNS